MVVPVRRRAILRVGGVIAGTLLVGGPPALSPFLRAAAPFILNGFTVEEPFASYWQQTGGLAQHGLPLSNRTTEPSFVDNRSYAIQYFERAVFELHPEFAGTENEVLLQLLGYLFYEKRYGPAGAPGQVSNMLPGSVVFPETGKRLGGRFLAYWQERGGLRQQGYPVSDEFREVSAIDGVTYTVQYFERAVFELHPEQQPPYDVLLSHLGRFAYARPPVLRILNPQDGQSLALPTEVRFEVDEPTGGLPSGSHLGVSVTDPSGSFALDLAVVSAGVAVLPDDKRLPGRRDLSFVLVQPDDTPYANPLARATVRELLIAGRR
jgi:hypothetical protein